MTEIRYDNVTKIYPNASAPAIQDVSFKVPTGSLVVLLGPSGCGKTTLLKMTNRLYEITSGKILIDEKDIQDLVKTELRRQIGYVIQQIGLFPHMTVAQNIAIVPELLEWKRPRIDERTEELLELVHLPVEFRDRYPSQLSGGQQQRVGLARALAADPSVMLMDEPFGAIDAITRYSLQDEMLRLQNKLHKTIIFVTHDVEEALRLADQIVVLRAGHLEQFDEPCNLLNNPANDFVRELLNADDRIRQLGLLKPEAVMVPIPQDFKPGSAPTMEASEDLRVALSYLLQPSISSVTVMEDGRPVGQVTLDRLRNAGCEDEI